MRSQFLVGIVSVGIVSLAALTGCGLEGVFAGAPHTPYERPASAFRGAAGWVGASGAQLTGLDGDGNPIAPFQAIVAAGAYEMRLPSARYTFVRVQARAGDMVFRHLVPEIGEETTLRGIDLDARSTTEAMIVEARLSADGQRLKQLTPSAYLGAQAAIRADLDLPGPTRDLLLMVGRLVDRADPTTSSIDPDLFTVPELDEAFVVTRSPVNAGFLSRVSVDYDGDGTRDRETTAFDAKLAAAAQRYKPAGCPDPTRVRLVFTADFNAGCLSGNGTPVDRFKWAVDKPGKRMFFVGWVHKESPVQDPAINTLVGASVPNQIPMYDDGTNGDEASGDGIWTVAFEVPVDPGAVLRLGYKYTWGLRGQVWTGSEEWPGNSRIIEVLDVGGAAGGPDGFVYRRDVFGDEATNKDNSNLSTRPGAKGSITWDTDLRGCGPESHEQKATLHDASTCLDPPLPGLGFVTPASMGPLTVACTGN